MFYDGGTIYFWLHRDASPSPVEGTPQSVYASYRREAQRHVSGLRDCIDYDEEDGTLMFANKTSLTVSCTVTGQLKSKIDFSELFRFCPDVDLRGTVSNDIYWIYTTLGISAVEVYLNREFTTVLGAEGININPQHVNLITANMTQSGEIRANKYSGLKGVEGVISKATFQQATETFCRAAASGTVDSVTDVSSQLILGKILGIGTAHTHMIRDVVERHVDLGVPEYVPEAHTDSCEYRPASPEPVSEKSDMTIEPEIHI